MGEGVNTYLNYKDMQLKKISIARFSYRATGSFSSIASSTIVGMKFGTPWGAASGLFISTSFWLYETAYDAWKSWQTQMATFLSNAENGLKTGWVPGK